MADSREKILVKEKLLVEAPESGERLFVKGTINYSNLETRMFIFTTDVNLWW